MQQQANHQTGRPTLPCNRILLDAATAVARVIDELDRDGFAVVGVSLDSPSCPTVHIQENRRCHALIHKGEAAYYGFGCRDHFGSYREGQFKRGGCRVVWREFGQR